MNFERPKVKALVEFQGADVFGEDGEESYSCSDATECLAQVLDRMLDPSVTGMSVQRWFTETEPFITIGAYKRTEVTPKWIDGQAESSAELLRDNFSEEHGDSDGDDRLTDDDGKELVRKMREVVSWYLTRAKVWSCEEIQSFTLDSADILEVVQQLRPEWLKVKQ